MSKASPQCPVCLGHGQVCDAHPFLAWGGALRNGYYRVDRVCWCDAGPRPCPCGLLEAIPTHNAQEVDGWRERNAVDDNGVEPEPPQTSVRSDLWNMVRWALFAMAITAVFGMVLNFLEGWL